MGGATESNFFFSKPNHNFDVLCLRGREQEGKEKSETIDVHRGKKNCIKLQQTILN